MAAIISRRPDAVFHPQFWAEDGAFWFADTYNLGAVRPLIQPLARELLTFNRLAAGVALAAPLKYAPFVMNALAIAVQALPALFLLTRRSAWLGPLPARAVMAIVFLSVPTSYEVHANVTNSMVFLSILAVLVIVAAPPATRTWRVADVVTISMAGLTGPFVVFLIPVAAVVWWRRRERWTLVLLAIAFCALTIQAALILANAALARSNAPLGATPLLFARIIGAQILIRPLFGMTSLDAHLSSANVLCVSAVAAAFALVLYVVRRGPFELRLLLLYAALVVGAALSTPLVSPTEVQWPLLTVRGVGGRYWLLPVTTLLWTYVWMAGRGRPAGVRLLGALATLSALVVGAANWRYPPFQDFQFGHYAQIVDSAPAGEVVVIPINPPGWTMMLRKR